MHNQICNGDNVGHVINNAMGKLADESNELAQRGLAKKL